MYVSLLWNLPFGCICMLNCCGGIHSWDQRSGDKQAPATSMKTVASCGSHQLLQLNYTVSFTERGLWILLQCSHGTKELLYGHDEEPITATSNNKYKKTIILKYCSVFWVCKEQFTQKENSVYLRTPMSMQSWLKTSSTPFIIRSRNLHPIWGGCTKWTALTEQILVGSKGFQRLRLHQKCCMDPFVIQSFCLPLKTIPHLLQMFRMLQRCFAVFCGLQNSSFKLHMWADCHVAW